MIPMRQLHTPVYNREQILNSIGSEEATNAIGVEFAKHAPNIIAQLKTTFDQEDYSTMQLLSLKLATLAHSSGAIQIAEFAKTIFQEVAADTPQDKDTIAIALVYIQQSFQEFLTILSRFTSVS